jgi:hypothetical protein
MPIKVLAAFGALPATIDAWVLTRGRTAGSGRVVEQRFEDELRDVPLRVRRELVLSGLAAPRPSVLSRSWKLMGDSPRQAAMSLLRAVR